MRKIKKIGGYLVVKFNDREIKEWGATLGTFGVIDEELYTGNLDIDKGALEFDGIDNLEEAIEEARSLVFPDEQLATHPAPNTIDKADNLTAEVCDSLCSRRETVEQVCGLEDDKRQKMFDEICEACPFDELVTRLKRFDLDVVEKKIAVWDKMLRRQIGNRHYPELNAHMARHELYGYLVALKDLGLINEDRCHVAYNYFDAEDETPKRTFEAETFAHLPPEKQSRTAREVYALGLALEEDCPQNDCRLYLNIFYMCKELDDQIGLLIGWAHELVDADLRKRYCELEKMYNTNLAIREYKRKLRAQTSENPPNERMLSTDMSGTTHKIGSD